MREDDPHASGDTVSALMRLGEPPRWHRGAGRESVPDPVLVRPVAVERLVRALVPELPAHRWFEHDAAGLILPHHPWHGPGPQAREGVAGRHQGDRGWEVGNRREVARHEDVEIE